MVSVPVGEVPEAIARIARPIHGDDELDQLIDLIGDARIVMLGECTHGTHEFYEMRSALTRRLIAQKNFAGLAIEGDWPDALRADRYVRRLGDDESADSALASFQRFPSWMWRNEVVAELLDWIRTYNRHFENASERAGFYGLDLYSLHASIRAVLSFLEHTEPELAAKARERYACFDHANGDPQRYGMHAFHGLADDCEDEVIDQLVEMQRRHSARSGRTPGGDAWFQAIQNAHVVKDAEAYYRTMFGGRSASWNLRDTHMADTLDMLAKHLGGKSPAKIVVWAHNSHVGDARATEMGRDGQLTLGQLARQRHPGEVALVGFTTHTGSVECAYDWDEPGHRERVRPSLPGSWEELFHESGVGNFMVTSAALKHTIGERAERLHRAIGVVYRPETERRSHYYQARLADQYDVIVHLDETRAVTTLDRDDLPSASATIDLPETFPTGV